MQKSKNINDYGLHGSGTQLGEQFISTGYTDRVPNWGSSSFQKRQLESYHALTLSMAVLAPVAWKLLRLKTLQKEVPDMPAAALLTPIQLKILAQIARDPFPEKPTVKDAFFAIARKGGFLKHNKSPGWQTLGAGFEKLLIMESAWFLKERCDQ